MPKAESGHRVTRRTRIEDILAHLALIFVAFTVLFPIIWIVSMALDPRNITRPTSLDLIPRGASLDAFKRVLTEPLANNVMFSTMLKNSLIVAGGVSICGHGAGGFRRLRLLPLPVSRAGNGGCSPSSPC